MDEILIPLAFFAMIAAIVIMPRYYKSQERQKLAEAMRAAIEKGQPLPSEVTEALVRAEPPKRIPAPKSDLRTGVIWMSIAAGLVLLGLIVGYSEPDHTLRFIAFAALPACVGAAFLILAFLNKPKA